VDSLEQLDDVLAEDVKLVLLNNVPVCQMQIAVQRCDSRAAGTKLESSGGLTLDTTADTRARASTVWPSAPEPTRCAYSIAASIYKARRYYSAHRRGIRERTREQTRQRDTYESPPQFLTWCCGIARRSPGCGSRGTRPDRVDVVSPAVEQFAGGEQRPSGRAIRWRRSRTQPPGLPPEAYTDTQRTDAKTKICEAYITVDRGIRRNTHLAPEGGDTAVGALAIAANWRVSAYDGGQYLLARLEPATPPDLADATRSLGNLLMDIGAAATAGVDELDPAQAARIQEVDRLEAVIVELCK
jgi:hypothetical protein